MLVSALTPRTASADLPIARDGFEEHEQGPTGHGWLNDWSLDEDSELLDTGGPHSGNSHLRLRGNNAWAARSAEVTGESSLRLRLWARLNGLADSEAVVEVSSDGSTYVELARWGRDDEGPYTFHDFDLSVTGLSFVSQFWVRARVDGDGDEGELFIDEVEVVNSVEVPDAPPDPGIAPINLDSLFDDWTGRANIADAAGDQVGSDRHDIAGFYWANNIDEGVNYHMIERHTRDGQPFNGENGQTFWARYMLHIDANNNGDYSESEDRRAVITYVPGNNSSMVNVKVYPANSLNKVFDSGWNDWGDSRSEGGLRVEFPLDWDDLGISFGGVIRMYATSFNGLSVFPVITDRVPDGNADIQWSPASVLGPWLLGGASVAGIVLIWLLSRRRRLWT